jgi:hypothetical protein
MTDEEPKTAPDVDETSGEGGTGAGDPEVPVDFTTFVLSLSSSAAFHLGLAPHPEHEAPCENLPMAKQTIDILAILQEKTKGNLDGAEERLLSEVLYNLRMSYVSAVKKCECSTGEGR